MRKITDFEAWVQERIKVSPETGCWMWQRSVNKLGYGTCGLGAFPGEQLAHRVSWLIRHGAIPNSIKVLHSCDMTSCVNPDHLFLGTDYDNSQDAVRKGRTCHGMRHRSRKLIDREVIEIKSIPFCYSDATVAAWYGVSVTTITHIRLGVTWTRVGEVSTKRRGHRRGEGCHKCLLTEEKALYALASPKNNSEIARELGVHNSTICALRKGRSWKHLPRT